MASPSDNPSLQPVTPETRVGLLVLIGLATAMLGFLIWGNLHFHQPVQFYILFQDVDGIDTQSPVKMDGVPIGTVQKIDLVPEGVRLSVVLHQDLTVYKNAYAHLRSTGIIGTRYVAFQPGFPIKGEPGDQRLKNGDTLIGAETPSLDAAIGRAANTLDQITANGKLKANFSAFMSNVHAIAATLRAALGPHRTPLPEMIRNFEKSSGRARDLLQRWNDALARNEGRIVTAIHTFRADVERFDAALVRLQNGEGSFGKWVSNSQFAENMKEDISQMKEDTDEVKRVLGVFTRTRVFWEFTPRENFRADNTHFDAGVRIEVTPSRYYYFGGANLGTNATIQHSDQDYERRNTVTGLIGANEGPVSGAVGLIRSRAGLELRYRPFQNDPIFGLNRMELLAQGFDFERDVVINGRTFNTPDYIAGARFRVTPNLAVGAQAEDLTEATSWMGFVDIAFEDKDFAQLLGFSSFKGVTWPAN